MLVSRRLLGSFKQNSQSKDKAENTTQAYVKDIELMLDFFKKEMWLITKQDVDDYIFYCRRNKISVKTINRRLVAARQFVNFLNEQDEVEIEKIGIQFKKIKIQRQEYLDDMLEMSDFDRMA